MDVIYGARKCNPLINYNKMSEIGIFMYSLNKDIIQCPDIRLTFFSLVTSFIASPVAGGPLFNCLF